MMANRHNATKRAFYERHGFWPHQERCSMCGRRRADHTVWNTDSTFDHEHVFHGSGERA
jgi:hypothetical protein